MKKNLVLVLVLFVNHLSFSQNLDLIVRTSGDSIACKIDSITESQIFLQIKTPKSRNWVQIIEDLNKVSGFEYNVIKPELYVFETGSTIILRKRNMSRYRDSKNLDLVVTNTGDSIACKIDSINESQLFIQIKTPRSNKWVQIVEDLNSMSSFEYNVINPELYIFKTGSTVIVGKRNFSDYRYAKSVYSYKDYVPAMNDKYDPSLAGVLSLIPGLGLCYAGEPLRSLAYVGGMAGSFGAMVAGFALSYDGESTRGIILFFAGAGGIVFFYIASFVSAIKIAKVKNMAYRDKALSLNFSPKIELKNQYTAVNSFGLRVALNF